MDNRNEKIEAAILKSFERPMRKIELGGDYYYKCYHIECDADVKSYDNYCWKCGQRLKANG